jgi:cell division septation protein DedD
VVKTMRGMVGAVLVAATMPGFAGVALADVKTGVDAWAAGNYEAAVREWQGPAAAGDPDAQFNLAQAYKLGRGVPRDLTRAETLYAAAAAKGHLQASDNYGLLLFQRGERVRAMPYIQAAAARGDARAQYIQGLALFNGDGVPKDWVRAYAYVSLAQQAGLPQATAALTQMDQHVSMADRQKSVAMAARMAADSESTRVRQVAAVDLDTTPATAPNLAAIAPDPSKPVPPRPVLARADRAGTAAAHAANVARDVRTTPKPPSASPPAPPASSPLRRPMPPREIPVTTRASGPWRLQLGAFGVLGNAEALWSRVKGRPELAGHGKLLSPAGKLTKLQAGGFASQAEASAACARLKAGGFTCLATRD